MKVRDLVCNDEFSFNCPFRIVRYAPTESDEDHVVILCRSSREHIPKKVLDSWISAINQNNGIVEIECYSTHLY